MGQFKTEVTRGTFDPRTYKTVDKDNWARKRKPEWMSTTGQIHFVRERQVPVVTPAKEERHHQGGRGQWLLWEDRLDTCHSYNVLEKKLSLAVLDVILNCPYL